MFRLLNKSLVRLMLLLLTVSAVILTGVAGRPPVHSNPPTDARCRPDPRTASVTGRAACPFTLSPVKLFGDVQVMEARMDPACPTDALCGPDKHHRCVPVKSRFMSDQRASQDITLAYVCARTSGAQTDSAPRL